MKKILLVAVAIVLIVLVFVLNRSDDNASEDLLNNDEDITLDPLDTVSPFYKDWLDALISTSTDPYQLGLDKDSRLSTEVQEYIINFRAQEDNLLDPVLCQYNTPPRTGAKLSYNMDGKAQFLLLSRGMGITPERAVVDLGYSDGSWKITKIECVSGETAPDREFSFEKQGFLLKNDEPPLDANTWYIVYEENGLDGHFAPLAFSAESMCIDSDGIESTCDSNSFRNATAVTVKGGMSEIGVDVKRIEF